MNKLTKFFTSVPGIVLVFVIAALPLIFGGIGSARAALTYYSDTYQSQVSMKNIGVQLNELDDNGDFHPVTMRTFDANTADGLVWDEGARNNYSGHLLNYMNAPEFNLELGRKYHEEISATNTGKIDQYVRITVYKYWLNGDNQIVKAADVSKSHAISPELIKINYINVDNGIWIEDLSARTLERQVFYYHKLLPVGEKTESLTESISIDSDFMKYVNVTVSESTSEDENGNKKIEKEFNYDSPYTFVLRADVDAVQTHNAYPAIKSAWGIDVDEAQIKNGILSLR